MIEKDLYVEQYLMPPRIDVPQGTNVQQLKFNFMDIVPEGNPRIYLEKPSGAEIYNDAEDFDFEAVPPYAIFNTTTQMTAESGQMNGQVRVTDSGNKILNSFPILFNVVESPSSDSAIESSDELTALDNALAKVQPAIDSLNETNNNAKKAESGRVSAEQTRESNENIRKGNENTRQSQETIRQQWYNDAKSELDNASFGIGTVSTGAAGSNAQASITGKPFKQLLNLTIPRGAKGDPGGINVKYVTSISNLSYDQDTIVVHTSASGTTCYGVYLYLANAKFASQTS